MSSVKIGFLSMLLVSTAGMTAETVYKASLKIKGEAVQIIGHGACNNSDPIEVVLPQELINKYKEFRVTKRETTQSQTTTSCATTLTTKVDQSFTVKEPTIPQSFLLSKNACDDKGSKGIMALCIYEGDSDDPPHNLVAEVKYSYDTKISVVEDVIDIAAANGTIEFTVKFSGNPKTIVTCYGKTSPNLEGDADCSGADFLSKESTPSTVTLSDLDNNAEYSFKVRLLDQSGGKSKWSKIYTATPIPTAFPLSVYNGKGGDFTFSCQSSSASSNWFLAVLLISWVIIRHRKKLAKSAPAGLVILALWLPSSQSHADFGQVNIGLLGSMYRPDLDSEKAAGGTIFPFYRCFFGKPGDQNGPINPLLGAEIDMHLFDGAGSLQLGLGLGYTFVTGKGLALDASGQPDCSQQLDKVKVTLHMYQIRPQLTYMFDYFKETVPLVPYIRGAVIAHGYTFRHGGKSAGTYMVDGITNKPSGFRFGYQAAAGLMLMLDFLEPSAVRASDIYEHVYLKGELSWTKIDTFGREGFQFSAKDVMGTEFPLMWTFGLVFELP